jgi:membrane associated rhomboid family serine protease
MLNTILPLWFVFGITVVFPAWLAIGMWFLLNIFGGLSSLGMGFGEGVAYFAHLGGFASGLLLVRPWMLGRRKPAATTWAGWRLPSRPTDLRPSSRSEGPHRDPWYP